HLAGAVRMYRGPAAAHSLDRLHEILEVAVLQDVADRSGFQGPKRFFIGGAVGEDDNLGFRQALLDEPDGLGLVESGHVLVQEDDVRRQALDDLDRLLCARGFAYELDVFPSLEEALDALTHNRDIVDDENPELDHG